MEEKNIIEELKKANTLEHKMLVDSMSVNSDVIVLKEKMAELRADKEKSSQWNMRLVSVLATIVVVLSGAFIKSYSDTQLLGNQVSKLEIVVGENNRKFGVQNSWIEQNFVERDEHQVRVDALQKEVDRLTSLLDVLYSRVNNVIATGNG